MFRGVSAINLDAKGRLAVPTRYRDVLHENNDGEIVITVNHSERCLWMYTLSEWVEVEKKLVKLPSFNKSAERLKRILIGHATEVSMDKAGRLLISQPLREFAGLDKEIVLIGQGNKFEIWDAAYWNQKQEEWLSDSENSFDNSVLETLSL